jgi:hypothetical protein
MGVDPDCCSGCASLAADIQWWSDLLDYVGARIPKDLLEVEDDCE